MIEWMKQYKGLWFCIVLLLLPCGGLAAENANDFTIPFMIAKQAGASTSYTLSLKIVALMTALTVLPALLITMSAFTRIIIVFSILRQGLSIANVPSNQILIGLALIMTLYVMMPVLQKMNTAGLQPYLQGQIDEQTAFTTTGDLLKRFMLKQTRKADLKVFSELAHVTYSSDSNVSFFVLMPAFITSELKTAFEIGFLVLLPFLVIDIVVASILMSMGMMMLSPTIISLPFKILFFVLVDGWTLLLTSLVTSFRM